MSTAHYLYNLGYGDGLNQRGIDTRYSASVEYLQGYEQGLEQRKINLKRLIIGLNK